MLVDKLIHTFDAGLRAVFTDAKPSRQRPDQEVAEGQLSDVERKKVAALMRINHVGEVCAQALYSGQAFTSKNAHIVASLEHAAKEETDHLAWCEMRIEELGGRKSILNPVWYASSFTIGALAGAIGDQWNLGFLAETEKQVGEHLAEHLTKLPKQDKKTRAIIEQMHEDETSHAEEAQKLGAATLPPPAKLAMKCASKVMTSTAYYL